MNSPIDIKCLSVNIRGLNKALKRRTVFRWLHQQNCPFVFLQETAQKSVKIFLESGMGR